MKPFTTTMVAMRGVCGWVTGQGPGAYLVAGWWPGGRWGCVEHGTEPPRGERVTAGRQDWWATSRAAVVVVGLASVAAVVVVAVGAVVGWQTVGCCCKLPPATDMLWYQSVANAFNNLARAGTNSFKEFERNLLLISYRSRSCSRQVS